MKKYSVRDLIANSTLELLMTKKIDDITVGEIVSNCNVSRRSFYNHFKDKFDVCNYIYDYLLDEYCWSNNGECCSLEQFFRNFQTLVESNKGSCVGKFLDNTMCYQGQNCIQDYIAARGVSDLIRLLRKNNREDLITHENLFLLEFYMRGMIGMRVSAVSGGKRKDTSGYDVDLTRYLPKELYDALTQYPDQANDST